MRWARTWHQRTIAFRSRGCSISQLGLVKPNTILPSTSIQARSTVTPAFSAALIARVRSDLLEGEGAACHQLFRFRWRMNHIGDGGIFGPHAPGLALDLRLQPAYSRFYVRHRLLHSGEIGLGLL